VKVDRIMKECGLKLKEVFIDISKLVVSELHEQLLNPSSEAYLSVAMVSRSSEDQAIAFLLT
jgi:hypothetical protein